MTWGTRGGSFPACVSLSGLGVHLREWTDADLPVMTALFDDPEVARWTPLASPFDLRAARAYLARARQVRAGGRGLHLAITAGGEQARGEVLLYRAGEAGQDAELAYAIGACYRRQRLAVRAVTMMTGYACGTLAVNRVILRVDPANQAGVALAEAAGFSLTAAEPVIRERRGRRETLLTWSRSTTG